MRVNKPVDAMLVVSALLIPLVTSFATSTDVPDTTTTPKLSSPTSATTPNKGEPPTTDIGVDRWSTTDRSTTTPTTSSSSTLKTTTTTVGATSSTTSPPTTTVTSTTSTSTQPTSVEWKDMDEEESRRLVDFVVAEIQKLKVEHKELDDCQELNLSSVLSGKKTGRKDHQIQRHFESSTSNEEHRGLLTEK